MIREMGNKADCGTNDGPIATCKIKLGDLSYLGESPSTSSGPFIAPVNLTAVINNCCIATQPNAISGSYFV